MVGGAICRQLIKDQTVQLITRKRDELDLCSQQDVMDFMRYERPNEVILAAATVGGISANNRMPAKFIYENLQIQNNVINAAHLNNVQKLLFLGSSCIYPKLAPQPMSEETLLTGQLEPTNEPYAVAKIAGIKMCESYNRQYGRDYRSLMPTNLFGPGDNYHAEDSHVVPALIRRFHEGKENNADEVVIWGSGTVLREFLYVEDLADACIFVHELEDVTYYSNVEKRCSHLNVGSGKEISIKILAEIIRDIVGFTGNIVFDRSKPDGMPRKLLNTEVMRSMGWEARVPLEEGIRLSYIDFKKRFASMTV